MTIKTTTSTLVLSLLLAGSEAIAMQNPVDELDRTRTTTPVKPVVEKPVEQPKPGVQTVVKKPVEQPKPTVQVQPKPTLQKPVEQPKPTVQVQPKPALQKQVEQPKPTVQPQPKPVQPVLEKPVEQPKLVVQPQPKLVVQPQPKPVQPVIEKPVELPKPVIQVQKPVEQPEPIVQVQKPVEQPKPVDETVNQKEGENLATPFVVPSITPNDLTASIMDLDLFQALVTANQPGASLQEKDAGTQAAIKVLNKAAQKQKQKEKEEKSSDPISTVSTDPILLNPEEEKVVLSLWERIFGKKGATEEIKTTPTEIPTPLETLTKEVTTPVLTSPVEPLTEEIKTTPVLTSPVETPITTEETTSSWLTKLNPFSFNWWGTTTPNDVAEDICILENGERPSNPQTSNLTPNPNGEGK